MVIDPPAKRCPSSPPARPIRSRVRPIGVPSNVTFGFGPEKNVLYITVDVSLYRDPAQGRGLHSLGPIAVCLGV